VSLIKMNSYKSIFDTATMNAQKISEIDMVHKIYPNFRYYGELFHFVMAANEWMYYSDPEAIRLSLHTNPSLTKHLVEVGPSRAGGGLPTIDVIESRHILLLTWLFTQLNEDWSDKKIVEFGGGYGNFARLAHKVVSPREWIIVDLEYISNLQRWFLREEEICDKNINFTTTKDYKSIDNIWLSIGTHSLSEMDIDTFMLYFDTSIKHSTYLFYANHNTRPSIDLIDKKFEVINTQFEVLAAQPYEDNNCTMYLFKNRLL
jgi:hypothetical protein